MLGIRHGCLLLMVTWTQSHPATLNYTANDFWVFLFYWFYLLLFKTFGMISHCCYYFYLWMFHKLNRPDSQITFQYRFWDHQLIFHFLCYVQSPIELLAVFLLCWRILLCDHTVTHCNVKIFVFYQGDILSPIKQYISPSVHGPSLKAYSIEIISLWVVKSW